MYYFSFLGRNRLPYIFWSQRKRKNTDRLRNNQWRLQQNKNKLSTTSPQRVLFYMHSVDQCTPFPNQLIASISSYWCPHTLNTQLPMDGGQTCFIFRFGDQGEIRKFNIYKERWETEDPKQCWLCILII